MANRNCRDVSNVYRYAVALADDNRGQIIDAFKFGASGYILKSSSGDEFLNFMKSLEDGELALNRSTATHLIQSLMEVRNGYRDQRPHLTDREREILALVADGCSNKVIGQRLSVSENTVKYHLKKILQKMNAQNRTEAVAYAMRIGLLDKDPT